LSTKSILLSGLQRSIVNVENLSELVFTKKDFSIFDTRQDLPEIPMPPRYYRKQQQLYEDNGVLVKETEKWI